MLEFLAESGKYSIMPIPVLQAELVIAIPLIGEIPSSNSSNILSFDRWVTKMYA